MNFTPETDKANAEVIIVRTGGESGRGAPGSGPAQEKTVARTLPLAVHGPLVEFDRKLYTVALTEWKLDDGRAVPVLTLGAAVEVKPNVWYQAYTEEFTDRTARVTEILAEFASDPRTNAEGKAKLRRFVRMLTERDGELTEFDGTFRRTKDKTEPEVRISGNVKGI